VQSTFSFNSCISGAKQRKDSGTEWYLNECINLVFIIIAKNLIELIVLEVQGSAISSGEKLMVDGVIFLALCV
jgi:hypothetical protein